jgi:hypothetical protein
VKKVASCQLPVASKEGIGGCTLHDIVAVVFTGN